MSLIVLWPSWIGLLWGFCAFLTEEKFVYFVSFCVFSPVCSELSVPVQVIAWKDSYLKDRNDLLLCRAGRKTLLTYSFSFSAPTIWNELPAAIWESSTLDTFKRRLKTHLASLNTHNVGLCCNTIF